ncbi:hypothetical protein EV286_107330 [Rhizobium sp. BK251]|nr:hypothetical protein EV286_107330 [Rhizobium sp. BK251]
MNKWALTTSDVEVLRIMSLAHLVADLAEAGEIGATQEVVRRLALVQEFPSTAHALLVIARGMQRVA